MFSDEELRKKYDVYGEEGLKDDHFGGGHYQSWNYFNEEFGKNNKPFPSSPQSLFQTKSKCEIFVMVINSNFNMNEN